MIGRYSIIVLGIYKLLIFQFLEQYGQKFDSMNFKNNQLIFEQTSKVFKKFSKKKDDHNNSTCDNTDNILFILCKRM